MRNRFGHFRNNNARSSTKKELLCSDINKSKKMDMKCLYYLVCGDHTTKVKIYIHYYLVVTSTLLSDCGYHDNIIVNNFHTGVKSQSHSNIVIR